ncbi:MAG TPA: hypothetical protein VD816_19135 [Ohtaekwangia sp.]|nr:hypothetical protein [Ohtaekwangia sp.]
MAGLFFEALMLVFIITYAQSDFHMADTREDSSPLKSLTALHQVVFRSNITSESCFEVTCRTPIHPIAISTLQIDLPGRRLALSDALLISPFERNHFYTLSTDNAP